MLSGDNGILTRATDAKTLIERQSIVEQAKTDVLGYQAENKGTDLKKSQLQSVLEKYFKNVPDLTNMQDLEILKIKLDTLAEYGNHNIEVKEIFDGKLSGDNPINTVTADEINTKIGAVVNGYSAQGLEWQVFYADQSETILISKTFATNSNFPVPIRGVGKEKDYEGSKDVKNSSYGLKWNSKWLEKCTTENENINAKATAYLCDSNNWLNYIQNPATYAAGGPTLELFLASWNKSQNRDLNILDSEINPSGYLQCKPDALYTSKPIIRDLNNGVYYTSTGPYDHDYWLASPCCIDESSLVIIQTTSEDKGRVYSNFYGVFQSQYSSIRPIVSIPTSKISINGDTVTVLP